jgi:hypothetical protein
MKQGDAFSTLLFNFALVQEKQNGLILNGTHQLLANPDNFNILGENVDAIRC